MCAYQSSCCSCDDKLFELKIGVVVVDPLSARLVVCKRACIWTLTFDDVSDIYIYMAHWYVYTRTIHIPHTAVHDPHRLFQVHSFVLGVLNDRGKV